MKITYINFKQTIFLITNLLLSLSAFANQKICMVLDLGGKQDKSFNQSAIIGFQQAQESLGLSKESLFLEAKSDKQIQEFLSAFSIDPRCNLIISVGFNPSGYVKNLAEKYSDRKYLTIDNEVVSSKKNVRSALFREDQGGFLMGSIAAMKSHSKKIGIIGGMDIPVMKRFALAYIAGAKYISPKMEVYHNIIGATPDAWNNPSKAKEIALSQFNNGADIIFQVAGTSGLGIFDATRQLNHLNENGKKYYTIGVDLNQNDLAPSMVLTSMVKHVDIAVYMAIKDLVEGKYSAETKYYDLRNGGIDWAFDKYNRPLFSGFEIRKINKIRSEIIDGKIKVPDYYEIAKKENKKI